jgi:hypothetical protein
MNNFLPKDYQVPKGKSGYMKFQQGANRFRILNAPILGYEIWAEKDGKNTPIRVKTEDEINPDMITEQNPVRHFWAMPVWNYQDKLIQILEVTQKSIQKSLTTLIQDEDWGDPTGYDIVVTKTGEKLETEYSIQPKPAKPLEAEIEAKFKEKYINLEMLYQGGDPFKKPDEIEELEEEGKKKQK